jgi:SAM-dependent methyltransferase
MAEVTRATMKHQIPCESFESQLRTLYLEQAQRNKNDYLDAHSHNLAVIRRDTSIFLRYCRFMPRTGAVLDWGCHHAPTACLVKMLRGNAVQIYGCDVHTENFDAFFNFAGLQYANLTHPYLLPYESDSFDAVIGTAVLEHVPNDSESLKELYRVLKPGGVFVVTTLPNRYSYTEWLNRCLHRPHHLRRYGLKEIKRTFLHNGFVPIAFGYHQVFPSLCSTRDLVNTKFVNTVAGMLASQSALGEKLWPFRCFASNVFIVGKKVAGLDNRYFDLHKRLE